MVVALTGRKISNDFGLGGEFYWRYLRGMRYQLNQWVTLLYSGYWVRRNTSNWLIVSEDLLHGTVISQGMCFGRNREIRS